MDTAWWHGSVIYHIYVRSFQDSNGDGIGDLRGLLSRLDYLKELGVDALWLSPIFASPNRDFGYDVSDYYAIQPELGTIDDVHALIQEAHKREIRIIFDLVLNHTSDEHPWFIESRSSKDSEKADYYIWSDDIPNNWMGAFGGRAWTFDQSRGQYYLHSFLKEQPDLNWRNNAVAEALFKMVRYWLELGIDGFRLDVINLIIKDETLRSNPKIVGSRPRPYDLQRHIFDRNRLESHAKIRQLRSVIDEYDGRMLVGEIMAELPGEPELAASYLGKENDELHLSFDFSLAYARFTASSWKRVSKRWYEATGSKRDPSWVLSNHDLPRFSSKVRGNRHKLKMAALFLLTQRGAVFIYYGEELGLPDSRVCPKEMHDPLGKKYWPFHRGRDLSRGPMVWSIGPGNGFSEAKSWLPVTKDANFYSVENQNLEPDSLLNFYRTAIALRKGDTVLTMGHCTFIEAENPHLLIYCRTLGAERRLIVLNMSSGYQTCSLADLVPGEEIAALRLFSTHPEGRAEERGLGPLELAPWQGSVYDLVAQRRKSRSS